RWLYGRCLLSVYPSHYEGWGLPVAEALAHGKYCVASATSSLPEVGGGLADYADPLDLPAWQGLLERALFDPAFLAAREARGRAGFRPTAWADGARQILLALRRLRPGRATRRLEPGTARPSPYGGRLPCAWSSAPSAPPTPRPGWATTPPS